MVCTPSLLKHIAKLRLDVQARQRHLRHARRSSSRVCEHTRSAVPRAPARTCRSAKTRPPRTRKKPRSSSCCAQRVRPRLERENKRLEPRGIEPKHAGFVADFERRRKTPEQRLDLFGRGRDLLRSRPHTRAGPRRARAPARSSARATRPPCSAAALAHVTLPCGLSSLTTTIGSRATPACSRSATCNGKAAKLTQAHRSTANLPLRPHRPSPFVFPHAQLAHKTLAHQPSARHVHAQRHQRAERRRFLGLFGQAHQRALMPLRQAQANATAALAPAPALCPRSITTNPNAPERKSRSAATASMRRQGPRLRFAVGMRTTTNADKSTPLSARSGG